MEAPLLITQDQIDAAVAPETLELYCRLHTAGVLPEDESRGTLTTYTALEDALGTATAHEPTLHDLAQALSDAATSLAVESFEEGFRRGVAFTQWLEASRARHPTTRHAAVA